MFEVTPMFLAKWLIHPEEKGRGGEQRKAIHAGPWKSQTVAQSLRMLTTPHPKVVAFFKKWHYLAFKSLS